MLADTDAIATVAVKDLATAKAFYEGKLGLKLAEREGRQGVLTYTAGKSKLLVYQSQFAGTNEATAVTWIVARGEVESIAKALKAKGVAFEHYDMPGLTLQGDVHVGTDMSVAWLKDPDGNIISVVSAS